MAFGGKVETRYVLSTVEKGTLTTSVSGSGQVSVLNQTDVQSEVSGEVIGVFVEPGQKITKGAIIAKLDPVEAQKAVRDAELNLESAKLSMEKLNGQIQTTQAENDLAQAQNDLAQLQLSQEIDSEDAEASKQKALDNIEKAYEDSFNKISDAFLDLPTIKEGLRDILSDINGLTIQMDSRDRGRLDDFKNAATTDFYSAKDKYGINFKSFKKITRYSEQSEIEAVLNETTETTKALAQAAKSENDYLNACIDYQDQPSSSVQESLDTLTEYLSLVNTHLSDLLAAQRSLQDYLEAKITAENELREISQNQPLDLSEAEFAVQKAQESMDELTSGGSLDIRAQDIQIRQKENALNDALDKLADYTVRAPYSGTVAAINYDIGDNASSGSAFASIITNQQIAEIPLNEVDVPKVKVGQKANLTFDAIDSLEITGEVAQIDTLATTTQGVVTYNVKILLDIQDERVRPGMSVSAVIITEVKQDILLVPIAAVKSDDEGSYVEMFEGTMPEDTTGQGVTSLTLPIQQAVETGISDDTSTEVISGLEEGDQIIVKTTTSTVTNTNTSTQAKSITSMLGGNKTGGGAPPAGGGAPPMD